MGAEGAWDAAADEGKVSVTKRRERPHSAVMHWMLPDSWKGGSSLLPIQRADQCLRGLLAHGPALVTTQSLRVGCVI